jgi:hypothetical protein
MWRLRNTNDIVVLIGQISPTAEYYSFTTFALWRPYSFIFASLGDSANTLNLKYDHGTGLFAYIVCFAETKKSHEVDMRLIVDDGVNGINGSNSRRRRRNDNKKSAYEIVMRSLVASGLSKDAINVLVLRPQPTIDNNNKNNNTTAVSSYSPWTYYELVLRIFRFRNQTERDIYLQCHDQPFYYVSANNSDLLLTTITSTTTNTTSYDTATCSSDDGIITGSCKSTDDINNGDDNNNNNNVDVNKNTRTIPTNPHQWWLPPSDPTGFRSRFHPKNVWEKEENLTSSFIQYGYDVITDLHRVFQKRTNVDDEEKNNEVERNNMDMNLFNYTNHSFGPLYIAAGTECLKDNTECLGGCPDAAYFGLNVVAEQQDDDGGNGGGSNHSSASSHNFETLTAWPTINELHVVTMVNHRVLNTSIYGSVALLTSRSRHVDPKHMTRNIRATSVGVTSYDFLDGSEHDDDDGPSSSLFVTWVFTRNPNHCRIIKQQQQQQQQQQHPQQLPSRRRLFGCTVINKRHISSSRYVTYCERIYLNPLTGTGPDYDSILPARLFRLFLKDGYRNNILEKRRDELHKKRKNITA